MAKERENTNGIANESVINCDQLPEVTNIQPMIRIIRGNRLCLIGICQQYMEWKPNV